MSDNEESDKIKIEVKGTQRKISKKYMKSEAFPTIITILCWYSLYFILLYVGGTVTTITTAFLYGMAGMGILMNLILMFIPLGDATLTRIAVSNVKNLNFRAARLSCMPYYRTVTIMTSSVMMMIVAGAMYSIGASWWYLMVLSSVTNMIALTRLFTKMEGAHGADIKEFLTKVHKLTYNQQRRL